MMISNIEREGAKRADIRKEFQESCERYQRVGREVEMAVGSCFAIYNDRPRDSDGMLPYSQEAIDEMDACFRKLGSN